jgi:protein subunit release factor A
MRELLFSVTKRDLEITYFSGTVAGGQHRNKHQNCVRIKHPESGVMVTGQDQRSREQNLRAAFKRLANHEKFRQWLKLKAAGESLEHEKIKKKVEKMMSPENLKIEYLEAV